MSLPPEVATALKDLLRARVAAKQAEERLIFELPSVVADEIHYNRKRANVGTEWAPVVKALTEA